MARMNDNNMVSIFFTRLLMTTILVVATYNPTPFSLLSYLGGQLGSAAIFDAWAIKVIILLVFGVLWYIFLKTAYQSLKGIAIALGALLLLGAYVLIGKASDFGYAVGNDAMIWIALFIVSFLLGVGASASILKRRWSGISNVDTVDSDNN